MYDNSPLNRVIKSYKPGIHYQGGRSKHPVEYEDGINKSTDGVMSLKINWETNTLIGIAQKPNSLLKKQVTDEDGNQTITFTDLQDRIILHRSFLDGGRVDTYYVYDMFDRLVMVMAPECSKIFNRRTSCMMPLSSSHITAYCYLYKYDGRGNLIYKQLPGGDITEMVYDNGNRLTMVNDGTRIGASSSDTDNIVRRWQKQTYDPLGRVIKQEQVVGSKSQQSSQTPKFMTSFHYDNYSPTAATGSYSLSMLARFGCCHRQRQGPPRKWSQDPRANCGTRFCLGLGDSDHRAAWLLLRLEVSAYPSCRVKLYGHRFSHLYQVRLRR